MPPEDEALPVGDTLAAWRGWWIDARCRCKLLCIPCRMLAEEYGGGHRVSEIARRLRCQSCGETPAVEMIDDPRGGREKGPYPPARRAPVPGL